MLCYNYNNTAIYRKAETVLENLYTLRSLITSILPITFWDILDIAVLAVILYKGISIVKETRAGGLLKGIAVLVIAYLLMELFQMKAMAYIMKSVFNIGLLALKTATLPLQSGMTLSKLSAMPARTFPLRRRVRSSSLSVSQSSANRSTRVLYLTQSPQRSFSEIFSGRTPLFTTALS